MRSTIAEREEELKSIKVDAPPSLPPFEWLALGLAVTFGVVAWREKSVP